LRSPAPTATSTAGSERWQRPGESCRPPSRRKVLRKTLSDTCRTAAMELEGIRVALFKSSQTDGAGVRGARVPPPGPSDRPRMLEPDLGGLEPPTGIDPDAAGSWTEVPI